jgi:hypothetical protein
MSDGALAAKLHSPLPPVPVPIPVPAMPITKPKNTTGKERTNINSRGQNQLPQVKSKSGSTSSLTQSECRWSGNFWGVGETGYDLLMGKLTSSIEVTADLVQFYKLRLDADEASLKHISKFSVGIELAKFEAPGSLKTGLEKIGAYYEECDKETKKNVAVSREKLLVVEQNLENLRVKKKEFELDYDKQVKLLRTEFAAMDKVSVMLCFLFTCTR